MSFSHIIWLIKSHLGPLTFKCLQLKLASLRLLLKVCVSMLNVKTYEVWISPDWFSLVEVSSVTGPVTDSWLFLIWLGSSLSVVKHDLLHLAQPGFGSHHSCETAIAKLYRYIWTTNVENGQLNVVIFVDLRKPFDLVDTNILLHKLALYLCDESSISWFRSYLQGTTHGGVLHQIFSSRIQHSQINSNKSDLRFCENKGQKDLKSAK